MAWGIGARHDQGDCYHVVSRRATTETVPADAPTRLFVYGTLIDPDCQRTVTGRTFPGRPARLDGWRRIVPSRGYPHLVPDPPASVAGVLLDGVTLADWRALDDYEDAGNLYIRRTADVSAGDDILTCEVYVGHRIPPDWR